ncbi:MAG: GNAT family N-acetyltransferase [Bacteroidetes bacterium]|nr:GNAT family N-acetyltransferase [Bacteroidota bacterium]
MNWECKKFEELNPHELYAILQLRSEVFVVEQNCVFQDMDDKDQKCFHLMCWEHKKLIAYTRLVPAGISYVESSIGRVVSSPSARKRGIGKELMQQSIHWVNLLLGKGIPIKIGAQLYLKKFYESFGFVQSSDVYLEDGISHIEMQLSQS